MKKPANKSVIAVLNTRLQDLFVHDTQPTEEAVRELLVQGANPDVLLSSASRETPLMWSMDGFNPELFRVLVEFGADVSARDINGDCILAQMVGSEYLHSFMAGNQAQRLIELEKIVDTLIARGCDVDARNDKGLTPLMIVAVYEDKGYFAEILLRRGADVHLRDPEGNTPLMRACLAASRSRKESQNRDIISELIVAGANSTATNAAGCTPMLATIEYGHYEAYEQLRRWDVPIDPSPRLPKLDFMVSCLRGDVARYEGEDLKHVINRRTLGDRTPLMWVAEAGDEETARWLIARGAEINRRDNLGWTPLAFAVHRARANMCVLLLDSGADINATFANERRSHPGYSMLGWAVERNGQDRENYPRMSSHREVARLLLGRGANPSRLNPRLVARSMAKEVLRAQRDRGMDVTLYDAALADDAVLIMDLAVRGANPNEKFDGETPLYIAAALGKAEAVLALIRYGANVNARCGSFGWTPLMRAAGGGYADIVRMLRDAGADESAKDSRGWDAARFAAEEGFAYPPK